MHSGQHEHRADLGNKGNPPGSSSERRYIAHGPVIGSNLNNGSGGTYWAYSIKDGAVGGIGAPQAGASGAIQTPGAITLLTGVSSGSLTFFP